MKIPKQIRQKMHKAAKAFSNASSIMDDVNQWFDDNGIDADVIRREKN